VTGTKTTRTPPRPFLLPKKKKVEADDDGLSSSYECRFSYEEQWNHQEPDILLSVHYGTQRKGNVSRSSLDYDRAQIIIGS
jgi:hypothetical protein